MKTYIEFRSSTYTFRAKKILEYANIPVKVIRKPQLSSNDGCGYFLVINDSDAKQAQELLKTDGISLKIKSFKGGLN